MPFINIILIWADWAGFIVGHGVTKYHIVARLVYDILISYLSGLIGLVLLWDIVSKNIT